MAAVDTREDLVPLKTDFDRSWRGYDTRQVRAYVRSVEADLRMVIADRDAAAANAEDLARQMEELRTENDRLRQKLVRVCRTPIEPDGLSERLLHMVELAEDEATEITERARAAADRSWAAAERAAQRLRERHEKLLTELDARRKEMAAEHEELVRRTRAEVDLMTRQATQSRRKLDEQSAKRRQQVEKDFEEAMSVRRANALQAIADKEKEANERMRKVLDEGQHKVDAMNKLRNRMAEQLQATQKLLSDATPLLQEPCEAPGTLAEFQVPSDVPEPRNGTVATG
jgi:colicin import membrane protein